MCLKLMSTVFGEWTEDGGLALISSSFPKQHPTHLTSASYRNIPGKRTDSRTMAFIAKQKLPLCDSHSAVSHYTLISSKTRIISFSLHFIGITDLYDNF